MLSSAVFLSAPPQVAVNGKTIQAVQSQFIRFQVLKHWIPLGVTCNGQSRRCNPNFLSSNLSSAVFLSAPPQVAVKVKTTYPGSEVPIFLSPSFLIIYFLNTAGVHFVVTAGHREREDYPGGPGATPS